MTKFQDLHKAAKGKEFIFILGTNYYERIDSAAKRAGRIDREFLIVYPDKQSRMQMMVDYLLKENGPKKGAPLEHAHIVGINKILKGLDGAWKRSLAAAWGRKPPAHIAGPLREAKKTRFVEICAAYTAFLSYQRIDQLIKTHFSAFTHRRVDMNKFGALLNDLEEIDQAKSARYRPEVRLSDYSNRKGATEEENELLNLFPEHPFPWPSWPASKPREPQRELQKKYGMTKPDTLSHMPGSGTPSPPLP